MLVTLLGSVTLARLVQQQNAQFPMLVTFVANRDAGQVGAFKERTSPRCW